MGLQQQWRLWWAKGETPVGHPDEAPKEAVSPAVSAAASTGGGLKVTRPSPNLGAHIFLSGKGTPGPCYLSLVLDPRGSE